MTATDYEAELAELRLSVAILSRHLRDAEREAAEYRVRLLACSDPAAFRPLRVVA